MQKRSWTGRMAGAALGAALAFAGAFDAAAQARRPARGANAELLESMGGAYQGPQADYVRQVGQKVAQAAGQGGRCRFTLVNTDVVNAFAAPPGCDIYVTRGLVGLLATEAELAAVLGHEVGHVSANHAGKRRTGSVLSSLGALALGLATGSSQLAQLAGQAAQYGLLSYSRNQESEADDLGVRYLAAAGYDPYALADALSALQAGDEIEARARGGEVKTAPQWSRSHPLTADRVARAAREAAKTGAQPGALPDGREPYLAAVDGMIFGDDPAQGLVQGRRFAHPGLGVAFEAPPGFTLTNSPNAVGVQGPGNVQAQFGAGPASAGLARYAEAVFAQVAGQAYVERGDPAAARINGVDAVILPARAQSNIGPVDLTVVAYGLREGGAAHFIAIAPAGRIGALAPLFDSFRPLGKAEAAALKPRRIRVVSVAPGDTSAGLARRMAVDDQPLERFLAINRLGAGESLPLGGKVKIVAEGR